MRLSSDLLPFASHAHVGWPISLVQTELDTVRQVLRTEWPQGRLTMHPGQFNQLGSPTSSVVQATVRDLTLHAEILEALGIPAHSGVLIIHGGGV